jgi:glycosyltransferase involved in cell wall biosynthesis
MQILVDVSRIAEVDARTGVQRVVRAVLRHLILDATVSGCEVVPVRASRWRRYRYAPSVCKEIAGLDHPSFKSGLVRISPGDVFLALDLAPKILPRHRSQLSQWRSSGAKVFFFVHDLLPMLHPEWFTAAGARNFRNWIDALAQHADGAICSTHAVAGELAACLERRQSRSIAIRVVRLGSDIMASVPTKGLPADFEHLSAQLRSARFVLMVGTLEPRKGHAQAISAFEQLWAEGEVTKLVVVGNVGWKAKDLVRRLRTHPQAGKNLVWLEGLSDEGLCHLYERAHGVLVASEAEGFGLPFVEAARFGKPVLARDIPVYREVAGNHATFFRARDAAALADELRRWLAAIVRGTAPCAGSIAVSTWADTAREIYQVIMGLDYSQLISASA